MICTKVDLFFEKLDKDFCVFRPQFWWVVGLRTGWWRWASFGGDFASSQLAPTIHPHLRPPPPPPPTTAPGRWARELRRTKPRANEREPAMSDSEQEMLIVTGMSGAG